MKTGLEYAFSPEKRAFDLAVATAMTPGAVASRLLLGSLLRGQPEPDSKPIFQQPRIGKNDEPFMIFKLRTLSSQDGKSLGPVTDIMRHYGFDEMTQARNILKGEMGVFGFRPMPDPTRQIIYAMATEAGAADLVEEHQRVVVPTTPGLFSTFSLAHHPDTLDYRRPETMDGRAEVLLESEIDDTLNGSLARDLGMMGQLLAAIARDEM